MLTLSNINYIINDNNILNNINLSFNEGINGVIGSNGAGKTTLFNAIYQNIDYTGNMYLNSVLLKRNDVAFVETQDRLYEYLTVDEYISFFTNNPKAEFLINYFDIPTNIYLNSLSTGERKKVSIITNILLDKKIYIFDESFNGLDINSVLLLKQLLKSIFFKNKIIIISSHILSSLKDLCEKVFILEDGSLLNIYNDSTFEKVEKYFDDKNQNKIKLLESFYVDY